jgi:2-hydroxymuconate-semialdehyde hydrolase
MMSTEVEVIRTEVIEHGRYRTAVARSGTGPSIVLLHGSGPGATGLANWEGTMRSELAESFTLVAPDIAGFGATRLADGSLPSDQSGRVAHIADLLGALGLENTFVVGNSMGGGIALRLALHHPELVARMVLMGSSGVSFPLTPEVDQLYDYTPSVANMRALFEVMAFDSTGVSDALVQARYEATLDSEVMSHWSAMFGPPRQAVIDDQALTDDELRSIDVPALIVHGAHDRVVPLDPCGLHLVRTLPDADLVVLGRCGHWSQVERGPSFRRAVASFFGAER